MRKVIDLPATTTMTVEQALKSALKDADTLGEVLIIGYDNHGQFYSRSSRMLKRDSLWLLVDGIKYTMEDGEP